MNETLIRLIFNVVFNASVSFLAGILVVTVVCRVFAIGRSRWLLFFLSLPFVKIVFDMIRGVPGNATAWYGWMPFDSFARRQLSAWVGFNAWGPHAGVGMRAFDEEGFRYGLSLADLFGGWLAARVGPEAPSILLAGVLAVSVMLVTRRIAHWLAFELRRRTDLANAQRLDLDTGRRKVSVYLSRTHSGTPFAGGIFKPYVCFPAETWHELNDAERNAVLGHELAHVYRFDAAQSFAIAILGDIFWFVPGYRAWQRRIERLREFLADKVAVEQGNDPAALASALLKVKELSLGVKRYELYSALTRRPSLLRERVEALLAQEPVRFRLGFRSLGTQILVAGLTTVFVLFMTLSGNSHEEVQEDLGSNLLQLLLEKVASAPFF